jgi:DMSO/TMAO reductase YedYZ molybdopterin-dependent catalytic subunit
VPLKDVLARAEPQSGARQVSIDGLDCALQGGGDFVEALDLDHALDGEVMLAIVDDLVRTYGNEQPK